MVVVEVEDVVLLMADVVRVMPLPRMDGHRSVDGRRIMVDGNVVDTCQLPTGFYTGR